MCEEVKATVAYVKDTAAMYRDEAKTVFVRIEDTTMKVQEVRELSETMRQRLTVVSDERLPAVTLNLDQPKT